MSSEVTVDENGNLIRVRFGADSSVDNWKEALDVVTQLSRERRLCRVLVDVRQQTDLADTMTLFEFAANLPRHMAFAVLCEQFRDKHRFIEDVATNRGMTVRDFTSEQQAIAWLQTTGASD